MLQRERPQGVRLGIEVEADALLSTSGMEAYSIALKRAEEASSDEMARDWSMVAARIARRSGRRASLLDVTRRTLSEWLALGRGKPGSSLIQGGGSRSTSVTLLIRPSSTTSVASSSLMPKNTMSHTRSSSLSFASSSAQATESLKRTAPSMSR
jgi:hypothetical protein